MPRARPRTDAIDRGLAAKGFGFGGVPRERAYHDALRDLAVPAMGHPPLLRRGVDGDGAEAYAAPAAVATYVRGRCAWRVVHVGR